MEFGIFNSLYLPKRLQDADPHGAEHARLFDEIEWVKAADRNGFKYPWATEHHFLDEYSHLSASESFLAYCAAVTQNIHLGSGIFNITPPVNHPARVAERVATLDLVSDGRVDFGTGESSSAAELGGFLVDRMRKREMCEGARGGRPAGGGCRSPAAAGSRRARRYGCCSAAAPTRRRCARRRAAR